LMAPLGPFTRSFAGPPNACFHVFHRAPSYFSTMLLGRGSGSSLIAGGSDGRISIFN